MSLANHTASSARVARTLAACVAAGVAMAGSAAAASSLSYDDTVNSGESSSVTVVVRRSAAFTINLKAPTAGRTRLYLEGTTAPKGGALIDTKTFACEGAAGTLSCSGSYEPLPKGTYTFRMKFTGTKTARLRLKVSW